MHRAPEWNNDSGTARGNPWRRLLGCCNVMMVLECWRQSSGYPL